MMDTIFEIASNVSTPLALAGVVACIFFFIIKMILSKMDFPKPTRAGAFDTIKLIVDRLFYLSLIAMLLGFAGYALKIYFVDALKVKSDTAVNIQNEDRIQELEEELGILNEKVDSQDEKIAYLKGQIDLLIAQQPSDLKPPSSRARKLAEDIQDYASPYELALKEIVEGRYLNAKTFLKMVEIGEGEGSQKELISNSSTPIPRELHLTPTPTPREMTPNQIPNSNIGSMTPSQNSDQSNPLLMPTEIIPEKEIKISLSDDVDMVFVYIPPGEFMMGSPEDEQDRDKDEGPQRKVVISEGFYLGKYEVTQAQWEEVMGDNPSYFKGNSNHPVEGVNWNDCHEFIDTLYKKKIGEFRLPSESEWEYACRSGTQTRFYWGDDPDYSLINEYAWYYRNSESKTHEVGLKKTNTWGLHDMSGNVWEWCEDHWHENYEGAPEDNRAWIKSDKSSGSGRVLRGGSWSFAPGDCRSAGRDGDAPVYRNYDIGFRVVYSRT